MSDPTPEPETGRALPGHADDWDSELAEVKASVLLDNLAGARDNLAEGSTYLVDACRLLEESRDLQALVDLVATIQDLKRSLASAESYVARSAGAVRRKGVDAPEATSDGRPITLHRAKTRTAWDHDGWKAAVLTAVLDDAVPRGHDVVDAETGEPVDLAAIVKNAQAVHGSTSPRTTSLKALGIVPGDFCTETPGPWTVQVIQPSK